MNETTIWKAEMPSLIDNAPAKTAIFTTGEYRPFSELAKKCYMTNGKMTRFMLKYGFLEIKKDCLCVAEKYKDFNLAVQGLVQNSHGRWNSELIFTQKGYERIVAFYECNCSYGERLAAELFMSDKCIVQLSYSNGVGIRKEGGKA